MTAADWVADTRKLTDAATEGPWEAYSVPDSKEQAGHSGVEAGDHEIILPWLDGSFLDANLIAASRTKLPEAVDAIQAVLDLADYLGGLADGDRHYANLIRAALDAALTRKDTP